MRERWPRFRPELSLPAATVAQLVRQALPDAKVVGYAPVTGGLANTNLRVTLAGPPCAVLLRLYQRDPRQAAKEAELDARLRAQGVPTARFLRLIEADGQTAAVLEWVDGRRLDQLVPGPDDLALGRAVGAVLARAHAVDVETAGLVNMTLGRDGLMAYLRLCLIEGPGAARLGAGLTGALLEFVSREAGRLAAWPARIGLAHGDCNASNFLLRDGAVAALLDWEFAFCGSAAFDFGNLLRPPVGESEAFCAGLGEGYCTQGGALPADWRRLARLTDLYAWTDFLGRATIAEPLIADARIMIEYTLRQWQ